jgi:D-lactate dehydrogenase (cytochrome)
VRGHVNAVHGGITIDLSEMSQIVRVRVDDLDATVEAGVTRLQLHKALKNTGLMFPITIERALDPDNRMNPAKMIREAHS